MLLDNSLPEKEREEIVRQIIKERKLLKSLPNPKKLPLWELDKHFHINLVIYKTVTLESQNYGEGKPELRRLRVDMKEDAIYILAINKQNAAKKFMKIINAYKKFVTQKQNEKELS